MSRNYHRVGAKSLLCPKKSSPSRCVCRRPPSPKLLGFRVSPEIPPNPPLQNSSPHSTPPSKLGKSTPERGFPGAGVTKQIVDHKGDELKAGTGRYLLRGSPNGLRRKRKPTQTRVSIQSVYFWVSNSCCFWLWFLQVKEALSSRSQATTLSFHRTNHGG